MGETLLKDKLSEDGELTIDIKDFKEILNIAIQDSVGAEVEELKSQMNDVQRKALFKDEGDDEGLETFSGSIIDPTYYDRKRFGQRFKSIMNGADMIRLFRSGSGPYVKLSPQMEKFAEILRYKGNFQEIEGKGLFGFKEYQAEQVEQYEKQFGTKALTTTDVGALVPVEYLATVLEFATAQSPILSKLWRMPMGSLSLKIPKLVQSSGSYFGGMQLYHPDEGAEKTATKPTFDTLTLTAKKLIGLIHFTDEVIADSAIAIINYCTNVMVRAIRWQTEKEVIIGTGANNQMLGIRNDPGINVVTRNTAGQLKYQDIINLDSSLDENFQDLTFVSRRATVNNLRLQMDTTSHPIFDEPFMTLFGLGMGSRLYGYELAKTRNCPAMGAKGDIILGDFGFYLWGVREEMTIATGTPRWEFDETSVRIVRRQDGLPGIPIAFSVLDGTAS